MTKLFRTIKDNELFTWKYIQTEDIRKYYTDLLYLVWQKDEKEITKTIKEGAEVIDDNASKPNYYNYNYCLSLFDMTSLSDKAKRIDWQNQLATKMVEEYFPNSDESDEFKRQIKSVLRRSFAVDNLSAALADFKFKYQREVSSVNTKADIDYNLGTEEPKDTNNEDSDNEDSDNATSIFGLTVGSVLWLYYYERMGIFKILGALMDDYNYRGKFPISGNGGGQVKPSAYQPLLDTICSLYRLGIGSNLRDRICLYQRVLGVTIDHKLDIQVERNEPFMKLFNKLINYMLEFYKAKQLAQAIQSANGGTITNQVRTSVKTQTSIRDTMLVLQQQFEKMEYGRNQINTFLGIATVYATICLLKLVKSEIGVPAQYDSPEEFIPAAYDILVLKRAPTFSENNRFTIFDNCASYGYRLLTDIQLANMQNFRANGVESSMDYWLNDIEGWVEGYNNAYQSVPESIEAIL